MSWIFGCFSNNIANGDIKKFQSMHGKSIHSIQNQNFYLAVGGNELTAFYSKGFPDGNSDSKSWIVSGIGILREDDSQKIMSSADWEEILKNSQFDPSSINGHFIVIIWGNDNKLKIYNDLIGFRTIYWISKAGKTLFTTELAWITNFLDEVRLDLNAFGSRWLTFNQLSHKSMILGVEKLHPAGIYEISHDKIIVKHRNWMLRNVESTSESFSGSLVPFLFPRTNDKLQVTLGLSGGLDSRTLLALILGETHRNNKEKFFLHSFGDKEDPDFITASKICETIDIESVLLSKDFLNKNDFDKILNEYARDSLLVEPVSSILKNIYFDDEYFKNKIIIDGANGEIARRQFYNRLLLKGKKDLILRKYRGMLNCLKVNRSNIFNEDVLNEMEKGCLTDLENIYEYLPPIEKIGVEKFIDLVAVKFRFPNYFGPEQRRLDKRVLSYMPFAQVSVLEEAFSLSSSLKRNSKLFYQMIGQNQPSLTKFQLIKNGISYPYGMNSLLAFLYTKIKSKFTKDVNSIKKTELFHKKKELIYDIVMSKEVKNFSLYNYDRVKKIIDQYFQGDISLLSQLDWWLTFELWRRSLSLS